MMDLKTLRSEIDKLSKIVEGWSAPACISKIEQDVVLEKLRALYDAVRFADVETERGPQDGTVMDVAAEVETLVEAVAVSGLEVGDEPTPESESELKSEAAEPESESQQEFVESESELKPEAVASESEWDLVVESESEHKPEAAEPESESQQEFVESESESELELESAVRSAKRSEVVAEVSVPVSAPTLFGLDADESEAEKLRHRHKQRVIMSLYGSEPERPPIEPLRPERPESSPIEPLRPERPPIEPEAFLDHSSAVDFEIVSERDAVSEPDAEMAVPEETDAKQTVAEEEEFVFEEISLTQNTVLGDVINPEVQTLADTLAAPRRNVASEIRRRESATDLRQSIGLNDKFLLIRDLFDGDTAACDRTLEILNGFDNLDDCMIHIAENYLWNPNSDGAKFMMELIERKFA